MKIAVFLPNWVGDAVMATPAIRALRRHFRGARILGVLKPYIAGVFEGCPWLDEQVFLDSKGPSEHSWIAAASHLRRERIELAILFPNTFRSALVALMGSCRRRVGYARHGRGMLLTDSLQPVRDQAGRLKPSPIIDAYNRLVERAGCPAPGFRMELFTNSEDEQAADTLWDKADLTRQREVICLNPGAAFGAAKHWPMEYFATLAQTLVDVRGAAVLVLCGPKEREQSRQIVRLANRSSVHGLADQPLSLGLTKACIRRADLLVTTDSGPRHFAAAFDRPVVTLFGPTHIAWTETYSPRAKHLQKQVECGPCQLRACPLDHRCMKLLTPSEVFAAVEDLMRSISTGEHEAA